MGTFDEMLASLHPNSEGVPQGAILEDERKNTPIIITQKRSFQIPDDYDTVLAYEGDVNSQIVTFKIPTTHEGHDLSACGLKTLRWKNTSSNVEDWSNLEVIDTNVNTTTLKWIVPPAAFVTAGTIEIAISLYDLVVVGGKNQIAFSWNTPTYSGFSVGKTLSDVGVEKTLLDVGEEPNIPQIIAPAKNEILFIHEETQSIVAPTGYNFTVTIQGNLNTDYVYFQTTKSLGGIDLTHGDTTISVIVTINKRTGAYVINKSDIATSFADGSQGAGLLSFIWRIPEGISREDKGYTGAFSIVICVTKENQKWFTTPFNKLQIGKSIIYNTEEALPVDYYNRIDGDIDTELTPRDVSGIVKHRSALTSEVEEKNIEKNEIVVIYDQNGSVRTLAIGDGNSSLKNAKTIETMMLELLENKFFVIDANTDNNT